MKENALTIQISLSADVLFDFDRADLRPDAETGLHKIAELIDAQARHGVLITGYTDAKDNVGGWRSQSENENGQALSVLTAQLRHLLGCQI
jgi:outer membrane protein OmpA-like peptidoglycan-associated protein